MRSHWLWLAKLSFPCPLAVIFNASTCIQAREHDSNLCNGHRHDIPSRRCCGEHRRSSRAITAGSRWQCLGLRSKMRAVIRFNSRRKSFIARRGETTALLLFFVVHLSDLRLRVSSHHSQSSFFFLGPKSYQEKEISRVLIDRSTHAWGFDASNPSWVKHRRMHRFVVGHPPFFFIPLPPTPGYPDPSHSRSFF